MVVSLLALFIFEQTIKQILLFNLSMIVMSEEWELTALFVLFVIKLLPKL